jgi:hypothetical protein
MKRIARFWKWGLFVVILLGIVLGLVYENEKRDLEDRFQFRVLKLEQGNNPQPWCQITVRHVHTHTMEIVARSNENLCLVGVGDIVGGDPQMGPNMQFYVHGIHGDLVQVFTMQEAHTLEK